MGLTILLLTGALTYPNLEEQERDSIKKESITQLEHIDFALTYMIDEAGRDVEQLSMDERVRYPDDSNFTNFLNATEETFVYNITPEEQAIIDVLKDFQVSHPYVNSCYMGRENGAFVRAFPRASPTQYDPRDRPWYQQALGSPGMVVVTDPYRSVTTDDMNIGITIALMDNGTVYGVVGADVTLVGLTSYMIEAGKVSGRDMILTDEVGTVLAFRDTGLLFTNVSEMMGGER
ncbi:MAG: hypothetical protein GXY70_08590 [Euryarchaeota archaeon]|nr:hypothetical protein [Euryarchaeota archaeon]